MSPQMCLLLYLKTLFRLVRCVFVLNRKKVTRVAHRSDNFIVIDKAFDLKINSNNKHEDTVQTIMKMKFPLLASESLFHEFYFMHRLDFSTSGLMCIPAHKKACQVASKAVQSRICRKYYLALVRGIFSKKMLDVNCPISRDSRVTEIEKMRTSGANDASRSARTVILVLEEGLYDNYLSSKILIRPVTGRRHQIRVHCSSIGHTIIGDYTYSNRKDVKPFRMFLHSLRLAIPNEIENLDVRTKDPFTEAQIRNWKPVVEYSNLEDGFIKIDSILE